MATPAPMPFADVPMPEHSRIVSMIVFKGDVLVATERAVYILRDGVLTPIRWSDGK